MDWLNYRPGTFNTCPPEAFVRKNGIDLQYICRDRDSTQIERHFEATLTEIKDYIGWLQQDVALYRSDLRQRADTLVAVRMEKLIEARRAANATKFKMRRREGAEATFKLPEKKKRLRPTGYKSTEGTIRTLELADYDDILRVVKNMTLVIERSPNAFKNMKEEDLRQHFLVQLNGQYEGDATGETFNFNGKTDIVIRVEGENVFISECKFWGGPVAFTATVDQILEYATWRDTILALLIFNRNKDLSAVLQQIPSLLVSHANFVRMIPYEDETGFRCIVHHRDDKQRHMMLTVLFFEVPT